MAKRTSMPWVTESDNLADEPDAADAASRFRDMPAAHLVRETSLAALFDVNPVGEGWTPLLAFRESVRPKDRERIVRPTKVAVRALAGASGPLNSAPSALRNCT